MIPGQDDVDTNRGGSNRFAVTPAAARVRSWPNHKARFPPMLSDAAGQTTRRMAVSKCQLRLGSRRFTRSAGGDVPFAGEMGRTSASWHRAGFPVPFGFVIGAPVMPHLPRRQACAGRSPEDSRGLDVRDATALTDGGDRGARDGRGGATPRGRRSRDTRRVCAPRPRGRCSRRGSIVGHGGGHRGCVLRGHERDVPERMRPRCRRRRRATREPGPAFVLELRCERLPRVGPIREERYVGPELVHRTDRVSG